MTGVCFLNIAILPLLNYTILTLLNCAHTNFTQLCMNVFKDPARAGLVRGEEEDLFQREEDDARLKGNELIDAARTRTARGLLKPLPPRITQVSFAS